jgi:tRNA 5-methylaminomethyl-2-thiouridine biosynthesis bifunctional protein
LHYVALVEADCLPGAETTTVSTEFAHALAKALGALGVAGPPAPGFYRLPFDQGRVLLNLCIGPRATSLAQLGMQADHILVDHEKPWTSRELRRLHALARRGTTLAWADARHQTDSNPALDAALWKPRGDGTLVFDPAWALRSSRTAPEREFEKAGRCTVIGAGISGALVARALALRGWQVTVLEKYPQAASGASGLPAGLVSASGNSPTDPLYGLTRSAYHLTRQMLQSILVQGEDWDEGGAIRAFAPGRRRGENITEQAGTNEDTASLNDASARSPWRPEALWLKPQAFIRACLATTGITLQCDAEVHRLRCDAGKWQALDAQGEVLASSELLVLCNAMDAARLLDQPNDAPADPLSPAARRALAQLHPIYGSVSSGPAADLPSRPALPVHGQGHFLPAVPGEKGLQWLAGAGFESDQSASDADCHQANLARVAQLVPGLAEPLQVQYEGGQLSLWRGQRCVSHDRLPLVGPATVGGQKGLWMCLAMGARGLTFAALCAELLAARLMGEPLPLPKRLARLLDAQRLQNRSTHQREDEGDAPIQLSAIF